MSSPSLFHPAVAAWFERSFRGPTAAQAQAWPAIKAMRNVLIAAPTGSGKTLAAFMAAIDNLVRQGLDGTLRDDTQVVYISPLKALSNDIRKNLDAPLSGIRAALGEQCLADVDIRTWVRTGDTPAGERQRMGRRPPHIIVTTPESLYVLLGSEFGPQNTCDHPDGDCRRDSRVGLEQARQPSSAIPRTARRALRRSSAPHRPLGDAEADRGCRAVSGRGRAGGRRGSRDRGFRATVARATSRWKSPIRRSKR